MANNSRQPFEYLIAGPCAAESEAQVYETAQRLHAVLSALPYPVAFFRAGVWKPRSNSADFCGAGEKALPWLQRIHNDFGLEICVEVANAQHVELCRKYGITNFWIGARTSVNPFTVQEIAEAVRGNSGTVLVKNPVIPDLKLWLGNVERFEKAGVKQVFAVHRGFANQNENVLRNAPCWEIPIAFKVARPDVPLICDPSHITGNTQYIKQISQIAIDYGYNGLMVETHCQPAAALSDAQQQLTPEALCELLNSLIFKYSANNPDDLLRQQRNLIYNIDTQLSQLLAKRMSVVEEIANIKRDNNIPLVQPNQWNNVVAHYTENALPDDEYHEFLQHFLDLLHQYSLQRQQKHNGE
ncbi:MAG: bifunctional 3-deoxy-7-phosphoheptulonate synthase/chorismate mutase type II [Bacteroidales bacterium]|nr:bifunctional 3-deoxy-7-phosphoheptulonate synthase/chorismate mutase type II [Bacteroidales bacterium]